ncbi:hypothetical protein [Rhizobium sp. Root651]|uniref:hypothetical protein n=1 Tax=Rhizobium sp. Root651 TaxID=1736577 RepID=UPI000714F518|nr:hypothetical protein [Rhizobium sp. Root651]KRA63106.1 hypothetical protein ASD85_06550 [Rhizobium sp. Root651]
MNKQQIENLFIRAAFIDSRLPINARPKQLKAAWFTPAALTEEDQRKWLVREQGDKPSQLHKTDKGPMHDWWMAFWDGQSVDTSRNDVRLWELANELMTLVADENNRRALWAWAKSKVGTLEAHQTKRRKSRKGFGTMTIHKRTQRDVSFTAWCRSEGNIDADGRKSPVHEMTGTRRKDRAIAVIEQYLVRGSSPNVERDGFGVLPVGPVFEHISVNIETDAPVNKGKTFERDADTVFAKDSVVFDWREYRNEERRRRAARKREAA